jgi:hypothetical protein
LSSSNTDDDWHFEVEGLPSIVLELTFLPSFFQYQQASELFLIVSYAWGFPNKM